MRHGRGEDSFLIGVITALLASRPPVSANCGNKKPKHAADESPKPKHRPRVFGENQSKQGDLNKPSSNAETQAGKKEN
jgi:hypothetical protein